MAANSKDHLPSFYEPLDLESYEIRMLTLLPGPPGSVVRCTLEKTFLINPTKYAALSYCWGDPKAATNIIVNDVEYPVTVNLADALHQLRSLNVTRVWVDALCINQADEEEKGHQIQYMKHIYSRSEETYAWTGKDESGVSGEAIFFLQVLLLERTRLEDFPHSHRPVPLGHESMLATSPAIRRHIFPNGCPRCLLENDFRALMTFFGLEYWKRRWIIQEIAAASRVQVMCGNERIALHEMITAISRCRASCYWVREVESSYYYLENVLGFRKLYQEDRKPLLTEAIRKSRNSFSTDPRDIIFALLGICHDGAELLPENVRYQYPAEVIISNLTKALIQKNGCLDLILINSVYKTTRNRGVLPTWTPDWLSHDIPDAAHRIAERPRGMQHVLPPADLPIDSGILRVQGISIGNILSITSGVQYETMSRDASDCADRPTSSPASPPSYYRDSHETRMTLIRCLTGDIPGAADSHFAATVMYALRAALGTQEFGFERGSDRTDERLATAQKAIITWVHTNSAFSIQEKSLEEWLKNGMAFRFWIGICNSHIALVLISVSLFILLAAAFYSLVPVSSFFFGRNRSIKGAGEALMGPFLCLWWYTVIFGPIIAVMVVRALAGVATFVATTIPRFEMGLIDLVSSSRRLLVSDQGLLGTTSVAAEPGDEICLLVGCPGAVILRPNHGDVCVGDDVRPRYQVIGTVDVHLSEEDRKKYGRFQSGGDGHRDHGFSRRYRDQGLLQDFDLV